MSPQAEISWISILLAGVAGVLVTLFGYVVERFRPSVKQQAEEAVWTKITSDLKESKEREARREKRIEALEEAREKDREEYEKRISDLEAQREVDRRRIADLETQNKDKDQRIAELTRQVQVQGKKKGLM